MKKRSNGTRAGLIRVLQQRGMSRGDAERVAPKFDMLSSRRSLTGLELQRYRYAVDKVYPKDSQKRTALRDRTVLLLLPELGLRVSEVGHLQMSDVRLDRNGEPAALHVLGKGNAKEPDGKWRWVPLRGVSRTLLTTWINRRGKRQGPLFLGPGGGTFRPESVRATLRKIAAKAGLSGKNPANPHEALLTPHMLRHTAATEAVRHGADVKDVQAMLGHGKPGTSSRLSRTTLTYLDV